MKMKIKIIIGSTRDGRFGDKPAKWIFDLASKRNEIQTEVLDLRDYEMPFYNKPISPASVVDGDYKNDVVNLWARKINEADAFIIVSPEYNHGTSGVLKNALDSVYKEWNNKPVAFVSYGSMGGARSVEHLRNNTVELQMASVRNAIHILSPWNLVNEDGTLKPSVLDEHEKNAEAMLDQLISWSLAFKSLRI